MDLIIFLGSGVSKPTDLPDVQEITQSVLSGKWHNQKDENFYKGEHPSEYFRQHNLVPHLQSFLRIIKEYCDAYFKARRDNETNYEELYYICQQLEDEEKGEIYNPIIKPFAEIVKNKISDVIIPHSGTFNSKMSLKFLASKSCRFIQCVVWNELSTRNEPIGLQLLLDLINDSGTKTVNIASVNHDLLVEKLLERSKIDFVDGFGERKGDIKFFDPELYDYSIAKVKIFKLHGSLNWFRYRKKLQTKNGDIAIDEYGVPIHPDHEHCKDENGDYYGLTLEGKPIFLTGSYNKLLDYNFGIFRTIHNKFDNCLSKTDYMIVSGYGWNDRGINGKLFEWILSSMNKRLILLHETPEESIKKRSKSAMWHRYDQLIQEKRLIPIKKWFCEVTKEEIIEILNEKK